MSNQTISLKKDQNFILTFKLTVPLGCQHPQDRNQIYTTSYGLDMFDRMFNCGASIMSLNNQRKCGADITVTYF